MNLRTIASFQLGKRHAIEAVAENRASFVTGLILVLLTAIPRNYDQTYILESPFWLLVLYFSRFSPALSCFGCFTRGLSAGIWKRQRQYRGRRNGVHLCRCFG